MKPVIWMTALLLAVAIIFLGNHNRAQARSQTGTASQNPAPASQANEEREIRRPDPMPNLAQSSGKKNAGDKSQTASGTASEKQFGRKGSARWSDTTNQAATTDQQKQWLAQGRQITVTGEVVDISCYMQLGKTGEKHIDCGSKCVRNGQPIGLLTKSKLLYLIVPEEHHPRRDGQTNLREQFATMMGKQVTVTGMLQQRAQGKTIFVSGL